MRHCRRTNLACFDFLFEILHRNVSPDVAAEVDEDSIDSLEAIEDSRKIIVVFNLSCNLRTVEVQHIAHEIVSKIYPVDFWECNVVSVEVTRSTAKFRRTRNSLKLFDLFVQTFNEYHNFLAESGRRGGLSVSARQHRHINPLHSQPFQRIDYLIEQRVVNIVSCISQRVGCSRVVDVL